MKRPSRRSDRFRSLLTLLLLFVPWRARRPLLARLFGWELHPTSRVGASWLAPRMLRLGPGTSIGHLNVCRDISLLELAEAASIGNLNWITGYPKAPAPAQFSHEADRQPMLLLGAHAAITLRHIIDATNTITIGRFSTVAGYRSQLMTHSVDIEKNQQGSAPINVGEYCFVGTRSTLLAGTALPDRSVLAAGSVLADALECPQQLYGGVPAKAIKPLDDAARYFTRRVGFVV